MEEKKDNRCSVKIVSKGLPVSLDNKIYINGKEVKGINQINLKWTTEKIDIIFGMVCPGIEISMNNISPKIQIADKTFPFTPEIQQMIEEITVGAVKDAVKKGKLGL